MLARMRMILARGERSLAGKTARNQDADVLVQGREKSLSRAAEELDIRPFYPRTGFDKRARSGARHANARGHGKCMMALTLGRIIFQDSGKIVICLPARETSSQGRLPYNIDLSWETGVWAMQ